MVNKKEFDKFTRKMWKRLKEGEKKYGKKYKIVNIKNEILDEACDLSNYSYLLFLKVNEFNKKIK
jgi:hypothetical protein